MKLGDIHLPALIEEHWSSPGGFLFELRSGTFDPAACERFVSFLRSIDDSPEEFVPRRVVALLWYVPLFLGWQRERVVEAGGHLAAFEHAEVQVRNELERLLGMP